MKEDKFECSAVLNGVEIELTNYCGLDCGSCIRKESKHFGFIKFEIIKKIVKLVQVRGDKEIVLSGIGDVFLHKDLYVFLDYIYKYLPSIKIYIMTKGQQVTSADIFKVKEYNNAGYNLNITYSIYSLHSEIYNKLTGGGELKALIDIIKLSHQANIHFNFEFLLTAENISEVDQYKKFCKIFGKNFHYSIPHNWGGLLKSEKYNKMYDNGLLIDYIDPLGKDEICIAFKGEYLFFDYLGNINKCAISKSNNNFYLGNIATQNMQEIQRNISKLNYHNCAECTYSQYKTRV